MTTTKPESEAPATEVSIESQVRRLRFAALRKIEKYHGIVSRRDRPNRRHGGWIDLVTKCADQEDIPALQRINKHLETPYGHTDDGYSALDSDEFATALKGFTRVVPEGSEELFATYMIFFSHIMYYSSVKHASRYIPLLQKYPDRVDRITYHVTHPPTSGSMPTIKDIERLLKLRDNTRMLPDFFAPTFVARDKPFSDALLLSESVIGYENGPAETRGAIRYLGRTLVSMIAESIDSGLLAGPHKNENYEWTTGRETRSKILHCSGNRRTAELLLLLRSVHDMIGNDDGHSAIEPYDLERLFRGLLLIDPNVTKTNSPMSMSTLDEFNTHSALFRFAIGAYLAQEGIPLSDKRVIERVNVSDHREAYMITDPAWIELVRRRSSKKEVDALIAFLGEKRSSSPVDAEEYLDSNAVASLRTGWL